jgi:hypothetical protein
MKAGVDRVTIEVCLSLQVDAPRTAKKVCVDA